MKRSLSLSVLLLGLAACPQSGGDAADLARPPDDLGAAGDLAGAADLRGGGLGGPVTGTTLAFVAGGLGGYGEVDDVTRAARFRAPYGMALDGAGNLYVADYTTIRKVVLATGGVTTLAGTPGTAGGGYADGVGTAAKFSLPEGVALYGGNLYVGDTNTYTLRRVDPATGQVTTIAGSIGQMFTTDGIGTAAGFRQISDVVSDGAGNLYISDGTNIRKMVLATGQVTTIAGDPANGAGSIDGTGTAARFRVPKGLALDGAGNLYVSDSNNHTIRKVVLATAQVTTIAGAAGSSGSQDGTGTAARFNYPTGLLFDGAGTLYVADNANHSIRAIALATAQVITVAGTAGSSGSQDGTGTAARFNYPTGLLSDGAGNLYISDKGNYTIRKLALGTLTVTTLAGTAPNPGFTDGTGTAARFKNPISATVDGAGNLYISDNGNYVIRRCYLPTGAVTTIAGTPGARGSIDAIGPAARFLAPSGVALDGDSLYVADGLNIRRVGLASGAVTTIAGSGLPGTSDGIGPAAKFGGTVHMVGDGAGTLYLVDAQGASIRKVDLATAAVTTLTSGLGGTIPNFPGLALDGAGNLYFPDSYSISKLELATSQITTIAGRKGAPGHVDGVGAAARIYSAQGMAIDSAGNLFFGERGVVGGNVRKVVLATGEVTTLVGLSERTGVKLGPLPASVSYPASATVFGGQLYLLDNLENSILVVR